jgi:hypothetical protein
MSNRESIVDTEHQEVTGLLAWYVNASLGEADQFRVESHLERCEICRDDLTFEQRVYRGIAVESGVEYMPAASLKRLQQRLDGLAQPAEADASAPRAPRRHWSWWQGAMAASVAVMALALSWTAAERWTQRSARLASPEYWTVTTTVARPPEEVIRAVFAPDITLVELQRLLDEAQLRIVAGPSEAGVYSLAAASGTAVNVSLARLRLHPTVRFAETTKVVADPGRSP